MPPKYNKDNPAPIQEEFVRLHWLMLSLCAVVADAAPALTYSTYLRDSFTPTAVAMDPAGNVYLAGNLSIDPSTRQTAVLIEKLNPQGTQILYTRYLGGSVNDTASAIAVDSAGNVYVAGSTESPDFPVTAGSQLGTPPPSGNDTPGAPGGPDIAGFIAKFDTNGEVIYSDLIGGTCRAQAQAVAVTPDGKPIVSGVCRKAGFPVTAGAAYSVASSEGQPFLMELDAAGKQAVFAVAGIGGSALAVDASGNIYMAGSTESLTYPTTPGVYQPAMPALLTCSFLCQLEFQAPDQYVTKVDPTGSKLIYSTAVTGGGAVNAGLAVDTDGAVYLTGFARFSISAGPDGYPFTVTPPAILTAPVIGNEPGLPYLTKLDPLGQKLLFSVPVGGNGVELDSAGNVYAGGGFGATAGGTGQTILADLPALAGVPAPCLATGNSTIQASAYISQADASSGSLLSTQFIGGDQLSLAGIALAGSTVWTAGATGDANVPYTPQALTLGQWSPLPGAGAYLGAVDFSQPSAPSGAPQIACILDGGDFTVAGPESRYQVLSVFGSGLSGQVNLGFTSVKDIVPLAAPLFYDSPSQINFAVPLVAFTQPFATLQVTVNSSNTAPRGLPLTYGNPHIFAGLVVNQDGSANSKSNPAPAGSTVTVFVNGIAPDPQVSTGPFNVFAQYEWNVNNVAMINPYVARIDLQAPAPHDGTNGACFNNFTLCEEIVDLFNGSQPFTAGPVYVSQ